MKKNMDDNNTEQASESGSKQTAFDDSQTRSDQDPTSGKCTCPASSDWIEVELLGAEDAPIRDQKCLVIDSAGVKHEGKTDARGILRLDSIAQGECAVQFLDLDESAVEIKN